MAIPQYVPSINTACDYSCTDSGLLVTSSPGLQLSVRVPNQLTRRRIYLDFEAFTTAGSTMILVGEVQLLNNSIVVARLPASVGTATIGQPLLSTVSSLFQSVMLNVNSIAMLAGDTVLINRPGQGTTSAQILLYPYNVNAECDSIRFVFNSITNPGTGSLSKVYAYLGCSSTMP